MIHQLFRWSVGMACAALALGPCLALAAPPASPKRSAIPSPEQIGAWIADLDSDVYATRERASQALAASGAAAIDALAAAALGDSPEASWRAASALEQVGVTGDEATLEKVMRAMERLSHAEKRGFGNALAELKQRWRLQKHLRASAEIAKLGGKLQTSTEGYAFSGRVVYPSATVLAPPVFSPAPVLETIELEGFTVEPDLPEPDLPEPGVSEPGVSEVGAPEAELFSKIAPTGEPYRLEESDAATPAADDPSARVLKAPESVARLLSKLGVRGLVERVEEAGAPEPTPPVADRPSPEPLVESPPLEDSPAPIARAIPLDPIKDADTVKALAEALARERAAKEIEAAPAAEPESAIGDTPPVALPDRTPAVEYSITPSTLILPYGGYPTIDSVEAPVDGDIASALVIDRNWKGGLEGLRWLKDVAGLGQVRFQEIKVSAELVRAVAAAPGVRNITFQNAQFDRAEVFKLLKERPELEIQAFAQAFLGVSGERHERGFHVTFVSPGSGAEKAGLQSGDVLIGVDGQPIPTFSHLTLSVASKQVGDKVTIKLLRDGAKELETTATLGARPEVARE